MMESTDKRNILDGFSDEELMKHFQEGVITAYDILVERYSERLGHYVYGFIRDRDACNDIVQETWLRVHRYRHSFEPRARLSTWLFTIAGNLAKSEYRRRKRQKTMPLTTIDKFGNEYMFPHPDGAPLPDRTAGGVIVREQVEKALGELNEGFSEVVTLCDVQELTYDEIAEITGLPLGTVKSRIHRGRGKIQGEFDNECPL